MSKKVAKRVEKMYLGTIATIFIIMVIIMIFINKMSWEVSVPLMMILSFAFIHTIMEWIKLFCNDDAE